MSTSVRQPDCILSFRWNSRIVKKKDFHKIRYTILKHFTQFHSHIQSVIKIGPKNKTNTSRVPLNSVVGRNCYSLLAFRNLFYRSNNVALKVKTASILNRINIFISLLANILLSVLFVLSPIYLHKSFIVTFKFLTFKFLIFHWFR